MRYIIILCLLILLPSCSLLPKPDLPPSIITNEKISYPYLPPISHPDPPGKLPLRYDYPRKSDGSLDVLNKKECIETPKSKRNELFWRKCGIPSIDHGSNLFIGFDRQGFENIVIYFKRLGVVIKQYKERIDQVNKQRQEWRDNNELQETEQKDK